MRKLVIAVVIFLVLVAGVLALAVFNVNRLLEANRGQIARVASEAVGREVGFEAARVAFPGRLSIEVNGLRVAEDPAFGKTDFLQLDSAFVAVEILPALQSHIEVAGVRLDSPRIRVIQTPDGFNFSTIGASADAGGTPPAGTPGSETGEDDTPPMALAIAGFEIVDGTILYEDRTANPPTSLTIEEFNSSGTDIVRLEGGGPIEIDFSGLVRPTRGAPELASRLEGRVEVADLESGAAKLMLESPSFRPGLIGIEIEAGDPQERIDGLDLTVVVPPNPAHAGYDVALRSSAGRLGGFDYESLDTDLNYRGSTLEVKRLEVGLAGGDVELEGDMTFGPPGKSPFSIETELRDLDSGELAAILLDIPRGYVTGRVGGDIDLSGDSLEWESLKRSLAGQIRLEMGEGALEQVNVLDRLVKQLMLDPGLGRLAADSIREFAPDELDGNRTDFEGVNLALAIADGTITADDVELVAGKFAIAGAGRLGLDGAVSGDGKIRFSEELSAKIKKKADELAPLLGEGPVVELPLVFGGTTDSIVLAPDLVGMAKMARANATPEARQDAARQITDAIFGKQKERAEGEAPTQEDRDREGVESLINEGLKGLLGQ
jgi:AsmA-like C-terminal region